MIWWQVQKRAGLEPLPFAAEEKIADTVKNLHECPAPAGVRSQLLPFGEGEEDDARLRALEHSAAHDARFGNVCGIEQFEGRRLVGGEQSALCHAHTLADVGGG